MIRGALRARFERQITFGESLRFGAKDTFAGAGVGSGEYCDRRDAGACAYRFEFQSPKHNAVKSNIAAINQLPVRIDDFVLRDQLIAVADVCDGQLRQAIARPMLGALNRVEQREQFRFVLIDVERRGMFVIPLRL